MSQRFSKDTEKKILELLPRYPERRAATIPALFMIQKELGCLPEAAQAQLAELLGLPPTQVKEVVSFYPMLHEKLRGRYHIQVCRTLSCAMRGSRTLVKRLEEKLHVHCGDVTPDGLFSVDTSECLGSCGTAPMLMMNGEYYENLSWEKVELLLEQAKRGELP